MKKIFYILLAGAAAFTGCGGPRDPGVEYAPQMYHALSYEPFRQIKDQKAPFKDGYNMQAPPEGTIARGQWGKLEYNDSTSDKDRAGRELKNPVPLTPEALAEGQVLFERFCMVCHGKGGQGDGTVPVVTDGKYPRPPKYKSRKDYPEGRVFHTITFGQNVMNGYGYVLNQEQRWKVVHYVNTLQDAINPPSATDSVKVEEPVAAPKPVQKKGAKKK